jgi:hypothetical protein
MLAAFFSEIMDVQGCEPGPHTFSKGEPRTATVFDIARFGTGKETS